LNVDINNIPNKDVYYSEAHNPTGEWNLLVVEDMASLKDLKAGDELADNYLSYGRESIPRIMWSNCAHKGLMALD
jgi:hypothetical protein